MQSFTQGKQAAEGVLSEANGNLSRDEIVVASGSGVIEPMTVLGRYTSGAKAGKYGPSPAAAGSPDVGNQVAKVINLYRVDATSADAAVAALARQCEVIGANLTYDASVDDATKTAAKVAELATAGIVVR